MKTLQINLVNFNSVVRFHIDEQICCYTKWQSSTSWGKSNQYISRDPKNIKRSEIARIAIETGQKHT